MKLLAGGGLVALTGALLYVFVDQSPADVYAMPVNEAYAKLASAKWEKGNGKLFSYSGGTVAGNGRDKVYWTNLHSNTKCEMALAPWTEDASWTHVTVDCGGSKVSYGPAQLSHNLFRASVIEGVDSTLVGREYDKERRGATAARWPGDGAVGGYGKAVGDAMQMSQEVAKAEQEYNASRSERQQQAEMDAFYSE